MTPSWFSNTFDMVFWKISGTDRIPNGSLLKQNLPKDATKVVRSLDATSRGN